MVRLNLMSTTQTEYGGNFYGPLILHKRCKIKQTIFVHVRESRAKYKLTVSIIQVSFFSISGFPGCQALRIIFQTVHKDEIRNGFWGILQDVLHVKMCIF